MDCPLSTPDWWTLPCYCDCRLLLTAVLVAAKCYEDTIYNNIYFAKVARRPQCCHLVTARACVQVHLALLLTKKGLSVFFHAVWLLLSRFLDKQPQVGFKMHRCAQTHAHTDTHIRMALYCIREGSLWPQIRYFFIFLKHASRNWLFSISGQTFDSCQA